MTRRRSDADSRRLGELFERALQLPTDARSAFIDDACGADAVLRTELASLLNSHQAAPDYLDSLAGQVLPAALQALPHEVLSPGDVVGHFEILDWIGGGGMGVVYKARDTALDRLVALKFLPIDRVADPDAQARLTAEARAASALDHPNIATVYEIGAVDAASGWPGVRRPFIAMAYYQGETLQDKIAEGPLPLHEAIDWAVQLADGLARAHEAGIVHRDIKAANVLVTDRGQVKVLDFGVAKIAGGELTREGSRLGTVAYMSPEQTRGEAVDQRSDLWSLGVLVYEMLTGVRPFRGDAEELVVYRIRHDEPPALETLRPEVPPELARVVHRCLAKNPAARYSSAETLLADFPSLASETSKGATAATTNRIGIVVLPFVNMSPDPDNEYFSDGLTEEVISQLSQIRALRVISRTSAMRLKGSDEDLRMISRRLGVRYVLEGSARKSGDDLRISTQLVDAGADQHMWAETYEGTVTEVLQIQQRVAEAVASALRIELSPGEQRELGRRGLEDPIALESYLRARHEMWSFSKEGLERARRHILNALDLVGDDELLLATLGQIHVWFLQTGVGPDPEHLDRASDCADAIFRIEPESRHGNRLRGFVEFQRGNLNGARSSLQISLKANPDDPDALATLGYIFCLAGREERGLAFFERLLAVDPLTPLNHAMPGFAAILQGRFSDAIEPYRTFLRMEEDGAFAMMNWVWVLALNRRIEEAAPTVRSLSAKYPGSPFASTAESLFHGFRGEPVAALEAISPALREAARHTEMFARFLAECLALGGDADGALDYLGQAVELGLAHHPFLSRIDPSFQDIRGEARFQELMERVEAKWRNFHE